jgi:membrane protein
MTRLRAYLLGIIGIVAGARAATHLMQKGLALPPPTPTTPSATGRKGGAAAGALAMHSSPPPGPQVPGIIEIDHAVSAPGAQQAHHPISEVHGPIGYARELFQRFSGDHCPAWAASLSFFSLLSIAPILLCGLAVLGFLIRDPEAAARQIEHLIANLLPGRGAQQSAHDIIVQLNIEKSAEGLIETRGIAGFVGLVSLFWSALQIFLNAMPPMNAAFRTVEVRGFIKLRLVALAMLVGTGLLFLLSLLPSSGSQILNSLNLPFLEKLPDPSPTWLDLIFWVIGVALNAVMFTLIYRYLPSPSAGVTWKSARFAGGIIAVLWECAKQAFAIYLQRFGSAGYNKLYGSLGGLVALVFWIYYSSIILLLGAEIAKLYQEVQEARQKELVSK